MYPMHLPRYYYETNESFLDYEFISEGPRGNIKKIIRFTQIGHFVYNLAFGDQDELTGKLNDIVVTNNEDSHKVLATVATAIYDFTNHYPGSYVIAKGSTYSRTRLYRMGITNYLKEISMEFRVYGLKGRIWESFIKGHNYEAFLIRRK